MEGVIFIFTLSLLHFFRKTPRQSVVLFQELLLADILKLIKKSYRKMSLFVLNVTGTLKKSVLLAVYFKLL